MDKKENNFKIPSQLLPIAYIILVCIGYTEKAFFYNKFDIDITQYLNFEEYLFIFLSIGSIIFTISLIISIYISGIISSYHVLFSVKKNKESKNVIKKKAEFKISKKIKKRLHKLGNFLFFFTATFPILILFYSCFFEDEKKYYTIILIFLWGLFISFIYLYEIIVNDSSRNLYSLYAFVMSFFIPAFWVIKSQSAENILNGKSKTQVSFITNKKVFTNDTIAYIGQTKEYLFLRNLKDNGNLIYKKSNISAFKIIK